MRIKKFLKDAELIKREKGYDLFKLVLEEHVYHLYCLSKNFSKYQIIFLKEDGTVIVEYMYLFGGRSQPYKEQKVVCKPLIDNSHYNIVVIRGVPNMIVGLDDGVYKSYSLPLQTHYIYFLSFHDLCTIFKKMI